MFDFLDIFKGKRIGVQSVRYETRAEKQLIVCSGDWHLGSNDCDIAKLKAHLQWLHRTDCRIILMGDLMEFSTGDSIGNGWNAQVQNPQSQIDAIVEALMPLRHKILVMLEGNHERRAKRAGLDPTKIMAKMLGVPYGGPACFVYLRVGSQNYTCHFQHGSSGARYLRTKMASLMKTADYIDGVDVFAMG